MFSKEAKLKRAERKRKKDKIDAYKELGEKNYDKGFTPDMSEKVRKSFKKTRRKNQKVDIAGEIKKSGDPYLGTLGNLRTKYKDAKTAKKAGAFKKGGMVIAPKSGSAHYKSKQNAKSIAKKYFKGGIN
jgi:hypothetical protein